MKAIKAVYSYYFPEIRESINTVTKKFPHETFLQSIEPGLDDFEKPIIQKFIKFYEKDQKGLDNFEYSYATAGSSEGIFHLLVWIKKEHPDTPIYAFVDEYEGYREYGKNIGLKIQEIPFEADTSKLPKGIWFISNPSARNGNIIPNEKILNICEQGHKVIYDLAYLGLTQKYKFDMSHPNIIAVVSSLSKTFGLFYYRVGFTFSRMQLPTLYPNKWFKNILSLLIAEEIFDTLEADTLYKKYKSYQKDILDQIHKEDGISLKQSDVLLLGYLEKNQYKSLPDEQKQLINQYKRGDIYRCCLTPYLLQN